MRQAQLVVRCLVSIPDRFKPRDLRRKSAVLAVAAASAIALAPRASHADQAYWTGNGGATWGATQSSGAVTNWDTSLAGGTDYGMQPGSGTDVFFSTTTPTPANLSNSLAAAYAINSLNFTSGTPTATIAAGTGGALTLNAASNVGISDLSTSAQNVTVGITLGGTQSWSNTGSALLTLGAVNNGGFSLTTQTVAAGNMTIGGALSGSGALLSNGTGTLTLSGANTSFTGPITVGPTGTTVINTLLVGNNAALGSTSSTLTVNGLNLSGSSGTQVELGSGITVTGKTITLNATATSQRSALSGATSGTETWAGNIALTGPVSAQIFSNGGTMIVGSSSANTITSDGNTSAGLAIRGSGNGTIKSTITLPTTLALGKTDAGSWTISSSGNTWGNTAINEGSIILGTNGALPATTALSLGQTGSPGTLNLNGFTQSVASITDTSSEPSVITSAASAVLTVNNSAADTYGTNTGTITGAGLALTKANAGILTLSRAETYSGPTTITGGTLALGATGSIASAKIDVQSGTTYDTSALASAYVLGAAQTLMGTGTVKVPTTGMTSSGTIAPGETSSGTLTISGPVVLNTSSAASFFLNTPGVAGGTNGDSLLSLTPGGNLTLNPNLTVNVVPGAGFTTGAYHLIDYSGTLTDSSNGFSGWTSPQLNALAYAYHFQFDTDNSVNAVDLVVTSVVPEPASPTLLGLGAAALLARRRRNRKA